MDEPADHRPFGVTVIIILQLISLASIIADLSGFPMSHLSNLIKLVPLSLYRSDLNYVAALGLGVIIFQVIVIFGLWRLQRWAWFLVMIQLGIGMGLSLLAYFNSYQLYNYMFLNVIMVFYLNQRDVQLAFGHKSRMPEVM